MAFQTGAFQPNAFQTGAPDLDMPSAIISDGNETVQLLYDDQSTLHSLGESVGQLSQDELQGPCVGPEILATSTFGTTAALGSHNVTLPSGISAGDRVVLLFVTGGSVSTTTPTGWESIYRNSAGTSAAYYRDCDGTEGSTVTVDIIATGSGFAVCFRIAGGSFDPFVSPMVMPVASGTSTLPNPPSLTVTWPGGDPTLFIGATTASAPTITGFPANMPDNNITSATIDVIGAATVVASTDTFDPDTFTYSASGAWSGRTYAVKGNCSGSIPPQVVFQDEIPYDDLPDYGFSVDPLSDDVVVAVDEPLLGDGTGLDSQDFTDYTDYGSTTDVAIENNDQEFRPDMVALDAQDFTDFTDYGFSVDPLSADNDQEFRPDMDGSMLDSQDFTDLNDYSFSVDPLSDDNDQEFRPDTVVLDYQDFTDFTDYGFVVAPLSDDFFPPEDFILGDGKGLDDQDFTDLNDYGFTQDPVGADVIAPEDFVLGDGTGLDIQDFTDLSDYGSTVDPLSDDNNPEIVSVAFGLDSQDFTDFADYSFVVAPLSDDNNPEVCVSSIDCDSQDFTDFTDYSVVVAPLSDNLAVIDEPLQNYLEFCNGTINDFFDLNEYGFVNNPDASLFTIPATIVNIGSYVIYVLPSDACQLIVHTWNYVTQPSPSWSEITQPSNSWNEVSQPSNIWSSISEPANTWSAVIEGSGLTWNQVC